MEVRNISSKPYRMAMELSILLFVLSLAFFMAPARGGKLCDFEKRFEHVRPTCSRWSKESETSTTKSVTGTKEDMMLSTTTTTTDGTSEETTVDVDCFEVYGNKTIQITNGSSTVNANCTKRNTCINGKIHDLEEYNCSSNAVCEVRNDTRKCYCVNGFHGDGEICTKEFTDCMDFFNAGDITNDTYAIKPSHWDGPPIDVYCQMSDGGGWTVFQRRVNGTVDFYRNWTSYRDGFGELDHEFWLGNDKLYYLTNQGNYTLRIDLVNSNGSSYYAEYDMFRINNESDGYRLSVLGVYSGTAGFDSLRYHWNLPFSTFDEDNDGSSGNCAIYYHGAWWYDNCCQSSLNGDYYHTDSMKSTFWQGLPGNEQNLRRTEMKIRPNI